MTDLPLCRIKKILDDITLDVLRRPLFLTVEVLAGCELVLSPTFFPILNPFWVQGGCIKFVVIS